MCQLTLVPTLGGLNPFFPPVGTHAFYCPALVSGRLIILALRHIAVIYQATCFTLSNGV